MLVVIGIPTYKYPIAKNTKLVLQPYHITKTLTIKRPAKMT
jgi:hypothetical protein